LRYAQVRGKVNTNIETW